MSLQDDTEKVLRQLHILISKAEPYSDEPGSVIIDKKEAQNLLTQLNQCFYEIMEEYEQSSESKAKAERAAKKEGETVLKDYQKRAEDVYAASIIYSDDALRHVWDIMGQTIQNMDELYARMSEQMKERQREVRKNQSELKSHLHDLEDTRKYLQIIETSRNKEEAEKKAEQLRTPRVKQDYNSRRSSVQVNSTVLSRLGLTDAAEAAKAASKMSEEEIAERILISSASDKKAKTTAKVSEKTKQEGASLKTSEPAKQQPVKEVSPVSKESQPAKQQMANNQAPEIFEEDDDFITIDIEEEMVKLQESQKKNGS